MYVPSHANTRYATPFTRSNCKCKHPHSVAGTTIEDIEHALQQQLLPICRGSRLRLMTLDTSPASPHLVVVSPVSQTSSFSVKKNAGKSILSLDGVSVAATALRLKRLVHDDRGQCDDDDDGMAEDSLEHR